jgi:hypothetical protein
MQQILAMMTGDQSQKGRAGWKARAACKHVVKREEDHKKQHHAWLASCHDCPDRTKILQFLPTTTKPSMDGHVVARIIL